MGNLFASYFIWKTDPPPPNVGPLSLLPVKKFGMGLQNSVVSAQDKYTSSLLASDKIIGGVKGKQLLSTDDHNRAVKGGRRDKKRR